MLVVVLALGWGWAAPHVRQAKEDALRDVERLVSDATGESFRIGDVQLGAFPLRVIVHHMALTASVDDSPIARIERIEAPVTLRGGKPILGDVVIVAPEVDLTVADDGKLSVLRNRAPPAEGGEPGAPLTELPFRTLTIVDGSVDVAWPDGAAAVDGLTLTPDDGTHRLVAALSARHNDLDVTGALDWPDLTLGPTTLEAPSLDLVLGPLGLTGSVRHELGGELQAVLMPTLDLDGLIPALPPPRETHGEVAATVRVSGTLAQPLAEARLTVDDLRVRVPGPRTPFLDYDLGDIVADAVASKDLIDAHRVVMSWADGEIIASAHIDPKALTLRNGHVAGRGLSLRRILQNTGAAPTPWVDLDGDADIEVEGTLNPLLLHGPFDLRVAQFKVNDRPATARGAVPILHLPAASATGLLTLHKDHIVLDGRHVRAGSSHASTRVDIGFKPEGPLDIQFEFDRADLSDFGPLGGAELQGTGRVGGHLWGEFKRMAFEGDGDVVDFSAVGFPWADHLVTDITSDMTGIALRDARATRGVTIYGGDIELGFKDGLSLDTEVDLGEGRVEDVLGLFIDLPGLTGDMAGSLSLHGPWENMQGGANLRFGEVHLFGETFDEGSSVSRMIDGELTLDSFELLRADREEHLLVSGEVTRGYLLDLDVEANGFRAERLDHLDVAAIPLAGDLSGHARVRGTLFEPEPTGGLALTTTRYGPSWLDPSRLDFETGDGVLSWTGDVLSGRATGGGTIRLWDDPGYALEAVLDAVPLHLAWPVAADGNPTSALVSGAIAAGGSLEDPTRPLDLTAALDEVALSWGRHTLTNPRPWRYEHHGEEFVLEDLTLEGGTTSVHFDAHGNGGFSIEGGGTLDTDLLRLVVPGLERADGSTGLEVTTIGTGHDAHARVTAHLDGTVFRHSGVPADFEDPRGTIVATPDGIEVSGLEAGLGGGRVTAAGGLQSESWLPVRWDLAAQVTDAQIQWIEELPPAIGDARLTFDGPAEALLLSGQVDIRDMAFTERIDWEDSVVEFRGLVDVQTTDVDAEPLFAIDLGITADDTILLDNNVASGRGSAELRVIGDTARPGMIGQVELYDAEAYLQDRTFRIERGRIDYTDPWTFDPELDFDLTTTVESQTRRYEVGYEVYGLYSDWQTRTRSDPALPQADINTLLWFGATTDELEQAGLPQAVAQSVADLLLTDLFSATQAAELRDELRFVDRIEFVTGLNSRGDYSFDPRLLVTKRFSRLGGIQLSGEVNLVRPEDQYYRLERRFGGIWSVAGWFATQQRDRVLAIGGAYGLDLSFRWEVP